MDLNMGKIDRMIRILLAIAIVVLYFTDVLTGTLGVILLVVAGVFVLTSLMGFCPAYTLLGTSTRKKK